MLRDDPEYRNRLKFVWNPFGKGNASDDASLKTDSSNQGLRISGTVKISFDAAIDRETAILSTMLVDLGAARRITEKQIPHEDGTYSFGVEETPSPYKVISRGWLNAQNRSCLWRKERIVPGETYHYEIDMVPTDYVLEPGHELALILYGIDAEATTRPDTVTRIEIDTAHLQAVVPMGSC